MTLRSLSAMAAARRAHDWQIASTMMALAANIARDPRRTSEFTPSDFNPLAKTPAPAQADIGILKDVFIHGKVPNLTKE